MKLLPNSLPPTFTKAGKQLGRYQVLLFIMFIVGLYSYVVLQINAAATVAPASSDAVTTAQVTPHIDPALVQQLQQLQDNSVSVKALFNQTRTNPFQ